jgi:hypothetical protein
MGGGENESFVFAEHFGQSPVTDFVTHLTGAVHDLPLNVEFPDGELAA